MGQFSWIYSDTGEPVYNDERADTYLLVPKEFQKKYGHAIYEPCYDGYGRFGGYDIYELIPEWNKEMIPEIIEKAKKNEWFYKYVPSEKELKELENYYLGKPIHCELRFLGITLACYDEDNEKLKYPIKITSVEMDYEAAEISKNDPNQGWRYLYEPWRRG